MARHRSLLRATLIIPVLVSVALLAGCGGSTELPAIPPPDTLPPTPKAAPYSTSTKADAQRATSDAQRDSTINTSLQNPK